MRKYLFVLCALYLLPMSLFAAPDLVYFGDTLAWNTDWKRSKSGVVSESLDLPEVSGIACSRVTPGYIWMQSDDYEDHIIATDETGANLYMTVKFSKKIRWDWEDMSGGVYNGTNYLFIGAFGDNDETDGSYSIVYLEEPAIDSTVQEITVTPSQIKFVYPDSKKHNCEALMYDNRDQMLYIITKVYYNVCQVFSLPMSLDYGSDTQTLTYVCDLGVKSDLGSDSKPYKGFHLVTGADISPDGKYILIKNHNNIVAKYSWVLLWKREDGESVGQTLQRERHPGPLKCYQYEWQGEAICWLDSMTFYTTSDSDGEPPIYKYRKTATGIETVHSAKEPKRMVMRDNVLYLRTKDGLYTLDGRKAE